ncbi:hypothetical protein NKG94_45155 [Micromonospora sp. M12]
MSHPSVNRRVSSPRVAHQLARWFAVTSPTSQFSRRGSTAGPGGGPPGHARRPSPPRPTPPAARRVLRPATGPAPSRPRPTGPDASRPDLTQAGPSRPGPTESDPSAPEASRPDPTRLNPAARHLTEQHPAGSGDGGSAAESATRDLAAQFEDEKPSRALSGPADLLLSAAALAVGALALWQVFRPLSQGSKYYLIIFWPAYSRWSSSPTRPT